MRSALQAAGDTVKLFVVASNMLGSSFGSTNAGSINPQTGEAYGPDFPNITIRDIVAAQKALLDHLGVRHLVAVAGPSYGGYQAFQWAVAYPDFMDAIVPVNTNERQAAEVAIAVDVLNRMLELGRPSYVRASHETRRAWDHCGHWLIHATRSLSAEPALGPPRQEQGGL
jgi:homoserine O-acetyltransferase